MIAGNQFGAMEERSFHSHLFFTPVFWHISAYPVWSRRKGKMKPLGITEHDRKAAKFEFHSFVRLIPVLLCANRNVPMSYCVIFEWHLIATCQSVLLFDCLLEHALMIDFSSSLIGFLAIRFERIIARFVCAWFVIKSSIVNQSRAAESLGPWVYSVSFKFRTKPNRLW